MYENSQMHSSIIGCKLNGVYNENYKTKLKNKYKFTDKENQGVKTQIKCQKF